MIVKNQSEKANAIKKGQSIHIKTIIELMVFEASKKAQFGILVAFLFAAVMRIEEKRVDRGKKHFGLMLEQRAFFHFLLGNV